MFMRQVIMCDVSVQYEPGFLRDIKDENNSRHSQAQNVDMTLDKSSEHFTAAV